MGPDIRKTSDHISHRTHRNISKDQGSLSNLRRICSYMPILAATEYPPPVQRTVPIHRSLAPPLSLRSSLARIPSCVIPEGGRQKIARPLLQLRELRSISRSAGIVSSRTNLRVLWPLRRTCRINNIYRQMYMSMMVRAREIIASAFTHNHSQKRDRSALSTFS